jgi:hypothetical protein
MARHPEPRAKRAIGEGWYRYADLTPFAIRCGAPSIRRPHDRGTRQPGGFSLDTFGNSPDHIATLTDERLPTDSREIEFDFRALSGLIDIIYGAIVGYMLVVVSQDVEPVFVTGHVNGIKIVLEVFVLNYLIGDVVESRLVTNRFPYVGHRRFGLDLLITFVFLLSFIAASHDSIFMLPGLAAAFFLGALWALALKIETKPNVNWVYPNIVVYTHFGVAVVYFVCWLFKLWTGSYQIDTLGAAVVWFIYSAWTIVSTWAKEFLKVPECEGQIFPMAFLDVGVRWIVRSLR